MNALCCVLLLLAELLALVDLAGVQTLEVAAGFRRNDTAESQESNQVRERHQTVEDVGEGPYEFQCEERTDENRQNVQVTVCRIGLSPCVRI